MEVASFSLLAGEKERKKEREGGKKSLQQR